MAPLISAAIGEQFHGYRNGHQLLGGDIALAQDDQDTVDRLSDISGQLRPGERFDPYFTAYPLPSRSFYVVAVTRQDLDAPRAGCVRTHSSFIPMAAWTEPDVSSVLHQSIGTDFGHTGEATWPAVEQSWTLELAEALFLEQRAPLVVFDTKDSALIALRLLAALWPSLRSAFSVCTFALAPRSLVGKSFDLVFAPKDARSRFSEWTGRRIDVTASSYNPRHRWAQTITDQIFVDTHPSLSRFDELGLLDEHPEGDEGRFRMVLLWKELTAAAHTAPQAVLGLMDIFTTAKPVNARAFDSLSQAFQSAISSATYQLPDFEFWQFIIALVEKFQGQPLPKGGFRRVRAAARERAKAAPRGCVLALSEIPSKQLIPKLIAASIGDGLAETEESLTDILKTLLQLGPIGEQIVSSSKSLAPRLISSIHVDSLSSSKVLLSILSNIDLRRRRVLLRRSATKFDNPEQADVLGLLLQGTTPLTFSLVTRAIGQNTQFKFVELNSALVDAAKRIGAISTLQNALAKASKNHNSGRALAQTITLNPSDFEWLKNRTEDDWYRAWVLSLVIDSATDAQLSRFGFNQADCVSALLTLSREDTLYLTQITRLLIMPTIEDAVLALYGIQAAQEKGLSDQMRSRLLSTLVRKLIGRPELMNDVTLRSIVENYARAASDWEVTDSLFPEGGSELALARALETYQSGTDNLKSKTYSQVEVVADRVVRTGLYGLTQPAISALADILEESGRSNRIGQTRASGRILNACFAATSLPIGDLVIATFPVVYSEVRSGSPGFTFLNLLFPDWDHCKTIRQQLVESYIRSVWEPIGLLICAWRVRDVYKIFQYLRKAHGGRDYLRSVHEDLQRYSGSNRDTLARAFGEVSNLNPLDHEEN